MRAVYTEYVLLTIPPDRERLYNYAPFISLALTVIFSGWWLARLRSLGTVSGRTTFLAAVGCLAITYPSYWIHANWIWNDWILPWKVEAMIAVEMPGIYLAFCLCFYFVLSVADKAGVFGDRTQLIGNSNFERRTRLLGILLLIGIVIPSWNRHSFYGELVDCWIVAIIVWVVVVVGVYLIDVFATRFARKQTESGSRSNLQ